MSELFIKRYSLSVDQMLPDDMRRYVGELIQFGLYLIAFIYRIHGFEILYLIDLHMQYNIVKPIDHATDDRVFLQEPYKNPVTSMQCWHVHCEACWIQSLVRCRYQTIVYMITDMIISNNIMYNSH